MRSLIDYAIFGGGINAVENASEQESLRSVCPDAGELVKVLLILGQADADALLTFDIVVNGSDSGWDVAIPDEQSQEVPVHALTEIAGVPTPLHINAGDRLYLRSNPAQTAATAMYVTYIVRR